VILPAVVCALVAAGALLAQEQPAAAETPLTAQDRLNQYVRRTFSWQRMAMLGADTVVDQLLDGSHQWHPGARGYFHRYSSSFGGRLVRNSIELGAGMALGEDTRFQQSHKHGLFTRLGYAASNTVMARDNQGKREFSYARLAATVGGTLITTVWRPCSSTPQHYFGEIGSGYFSHLQNSLLAEFTPDLVRFGKKMRTAILKK
jgi:hypothetical protein